MSIVDNKKAFHDYFIEEKFEAGLMLEGWEVKKAKATPEQREALLSEERAEYKKRRAAFFGPVQSTMARLSVSGGGGLLNVL